MEFLKIISKRRSLWSEIIYVALNVGLAIGLLLVVRYTNSLVPALIIVLLSKWRVFAVRTRFWLANIQANAVCFIVSISYVIFLFAANPAISDNSDWSSLIIQSILAALYIAWLVLLKPQSKRIYVVSQAGTALFTGVTALYMVSYGWIAAPVVALVWLIGYVAARHVLASYEEDHVIFLSLSFGLIIAEIGWLAYHWVIAYSVPFLTNLLIPQVSIITLATGFLAYMGYDSFYHHQKIRTAEMVLPLVFTIGLVGILILFRNGIDQIIL